jgi:REP element-mobilizing transposase RayT
LSAYGSIVENAITNVANIYPDITITKYIIMPNHIHLIIMLPNEGGRPMVVPTVSRIVQQLKGYASKQAGFALWQSRFYDHIIRNEQDYLDIWQYIDSNPSKMA